jgi:hypothetical protein
MVMVSVVHHIRRVRITARLQMVMIVTVTLVVVVAAVAVFMSQVPIASTYAHMFQTIEY